MIKKLRDYQQEVTLEDVDKLIDLACEYEMDVYWAEDVLNDFYIIVNDPKIIKANNSRPRKYIITYPVYASEMSNRLYMRHTDKLSVAIDYAKRYHCDDFMQE